MLWPNTAALLLFRPLLQRVGTTLFGPNGDPRVIPQVASNAEAEPIFKVNDKISKSLNSLHRCPRSTGPILFVLNINS
jgi:hypothetical protein